MHANFVGEFVRFAVVAVYARRNDIVPARYTPLVTRQHVIEIELFLGKLDATILTGIMITQKNIMPGEFDFLAGKLVVNGEHDHLRNLHCKTH